MLCHAHAILADVADNSPVQVENARTASPSARARRPSAGNLSPDASRMPAASDRAPLPQLQLQQQPAGENATSTEERTTQQPQQRSATPSPRPGPSVPWPSSPPPPSPKTSTSSRRLHSSPRLNTATRRCAFASATAAAPRHFWPLGICLRLRAAPRCCLCFHHHVRHLSCAYSYSVWCGTFSRRLNVWQMSSAVHVTSAEAIIMYVDHKIHPVYGAEVLHQKLINSS